MFSKLNESTIASYETSLDESNQNHWKFEGLFNQIEQQTKKKRIEP